jgi:hypothetical protein
MLGQDLEPGEDVHQGRFAGTLQADDRGHAALLDLERDTAQRVDVGVALAVALYQVAGGDNARRLRREGEYTAIDVLLQG